MPMKFGFRINDTFIPREDYDAYCIGYLALQLPPEEIDECIQLVYSQARCVYYEQYHDPAARDLLHEDSSYRHYLWIEDYSLKVFLEINRVMHICILMEPVFV